MHSKTLKLANLFTLLSRLRGRNASPVGLARVIEYVRQRWRLRLLLSGLCAFLIGAVVLVSLFAWLLDYWHFIDPALWILRLATLIGIVGLLFRFVARPLKRQPADSTVALYLEEHEPDLTSIILSAVDARQSETKNISAGLVSRLVEQAEDACATVDFGRRVEQKKLRQEASKLGLVFLFIIGLIIFPAEFLRNSVPMLLMPWTASVDYSPYRIELRPGDIEIARGGDLLVSASISGIEVDQATLYASADNGASWRQFNMTSAGEPGVYESFLFDLNEAQDYYVEAARLRSAQFRVEVADIAAIAEISLRYQFPAYTLLAPEVTQGSGDITALRGSNVEVRIKPTIDIPGGELLLEDGQSIRLARNSEQFWSGEIDVEASGSYTVALQRASGKISDHAAQFRIDVLDDKPPAVSIRSPARDVKVSMVEEAILRVRALDDQGILNLDLMLSVNGADEQIIDLMQGHDKNSANNRVDAGHTLYLEDLRLKPGDLISYYVQARDRAPESASRTATSDIYFYQIRPFSNDYFQSEQQGGGAGSAQGGQQDGFLAEQQKQFIVATFKMIRDRATFSAETYAQNLALLAKAQARIRDRVEAILRRISGREISGAEDGYRVIAGELPLAVVAMLEVEENLSASGIKSALSSAQVALQHLQRADAAFKRINITLANRGGSAARGNSANAEDLANLFKLEMDKLRHQYETVQHGQQQSTEAAIDETLERLRELAERQQQSLEQRLQRQGQATGNDPDKKQLALANELEEMARQLQRLTRDQQNPQLQQSIDQMKAAAGAMRRSAGGSAGAAGGIAQARQAGENIREAQRLLDQSRAQKFSAEVTRGLRQAELAEQKQAQIKQQVHELEKEYGEEFKDQLSLIDYQKQELSTAIDALKQTLNRLAGEAREQQPEAHQALTQALRAARESRLQDRIQRARDLLLLNQKQHALDNETAIQDGIVTMREKIQTALDNVRLESPDGLQRSLERMRAMARELRLIRQRTANSGPNQAAVGAGSGQGGSAGYVTIQQELEGIATQAQDLQRRLLSQGVAAAEIDPVLEKLARLAQDTRDISAADELHDQALRALMELEYKLRRQATVAAYPDLLITRSGDLPEEYKDMVAEYFRKLSHAE